MSEELLSAAMDYMERGLRVIALTGKMPNGRVHPHGLKDSLAYSDIADSLRSVGATGGVIHPSFFDPFRHPATTGVGILTGRPYYVVDIDGPEGAEEWRALAGEEDWLPDRWVAKTGRGLHLWFAVSLDDWPKQWPTAKLGSKLDFKGDGGYVAAPPSLHPDGHRYEWLLPPDGPVLTMPDALATELRRREFERSRSALARNVHRQTADKPLKDGKWYPVATFDGIIERMRSEPEGNRNAVLYWAARTMLEEGADDEDLEELLDAAIGAGLAKRESIRTIRSAANA